MFRKALIDGNAGAPCRQATSSRGRVHAVRSYQTSLRQSNIHTFPLMPGQWTRSLESCLSQARAISTAHRQSVKYITPLKGDELGPTREDGHCTFRTRKDGKKELPLPPLLDPVVLEKRSRHEQKKEKPKFADFTPFQRKLWENPFGMRHILPSMTFTNDPKPMHSPPQYVNAVQLKPLLPQPSLPPYTRALIPPPAIHGFYPSL